MTTLDTRYCVIRIGALLTLLAPAANAEPFLVRNQHPMVALFGLPSPLPARLPAPGIGALAVSANWTNFEVTDAVGERAFTLDGEVVDWRLQAEHSFGERLAMHVELAYRTLDRGTLDTVIDDWHSTFGLPGGSRRKLPEDDLLLELRAGTTAPLRIDTARSGVADVPIALGYQLHASQATAVSTWLTVKAPSGDADDLTGSGAPDVALSVAAATILAPRWEAFAQANVAWLGEGDVLPEFQEDFAWSLLGGVSWNAWRGLDLTAQVEANSAVFDTGLDHFDGDAIVLTLGGSYTTPGGWRFDLGIVEDVEADASPDLTFNVAVHHDF